MNALTSFFKHGPITNGFTVSIPGHAFLINIDKLPIGSFGGHLGKPHPTFLWLSGIIARVVLEHGCFQESVPLGNSVRVETVFVEFPLNDLAQQSNEVVYKMPGTTVDVAKMNEAQVRQLWSSQHAACTVIGIVMSHVMRCPEKMF